MLDGTTNTKIKLNPLLRVRFEDTPQCDLLLEGTTVRLPEIRYVRLLPRLCDAQDRRAVDDVVRDELACDPEFARRVVAELLRSKVLVAEHYESERMDGVKHWVERGWLEGLILHLRTQDLHYYDSESDDPDRANNEAFGSLRAAEPPPEFFKTYPDAPAVALPPPGDPFGDETLDQVLLRRRSNRRYVVKEMSLENLSTLLAAANVETRRVRMEALERLDAEPRYFLRSAFTALETYVYAFRVNGLPQGLYHYDVRDHRLVLLRADVSRDEVSEMCIGQGKARGGAISLLMTSVWDRYMYRYRHARAYRNVMINCAELAQQYIVLATALGLNTFLTPNILAAPSAEALGIKEFDESVLYCVTAG